MSRKHLADSAHQPPNPDFKRGSRIQLQIDRLSLGGDAVGRAGGAVVFVPYGAPGDTLEVELIDVQRNFARGKLIRVIEASPVRIEPPCPYHFKPGSSDLFCGGCNWQHMVYDFHLDAKTQLVEETLERLGGVQDVTVKPALGMSDPWRYRNKVQQPVGWDGQRLISGFYSPFSHRIVPIEDCLVQNEMSVKILNRTRELLDRFRIQAYDEDKHTGWIRHFWIRTNRQEQAFLVFVTRTEDFPHQSEIIGTLIQEFPGLVGIHQNINPGKTNVILGRQWRTCAGAEALEERLGSLRFLLSPGSFFQVNTPQTEVLYNKVRDFAGRGDTLLDMYCGVGTITLWLASSFRQVIGVDEVKNAIFDARKNAELNSIKNSRFIASPAAAYLRTASRELPPRGLTVVLDPPRSGCEPQVLEALIRLRPHNLVYVSCDPGTLARDIKILGKAGYKPLEVQPVDLFPQTAHIETVVRLSTSNR
jgi:23S rRNA (uracil1939-C5)-methyltransferase